MVEKDFRKIITDLELDNKLKLKQIILFEQIKEVILTHLSSHVELVNCQMAGSWAKNTMLKDDPLDIVVNINVKQPLEQSLLTKVLINEIESSLIYGIPNLNLVERNLFQNELKVRIDETDLNIFIREPHEISEIKQINFVEYANQEFTYFKNTLLLIKYASDDLKLKTINDSLIEVLLYYSLTYHKTENKYYDYLGSLCKGMEDFFSGRIIELSDAMYEQLGTIQSDQLFSSKYVVLDILKRKNLAEGLNDINISDYRRLKKKIAKMLENPKEDKFIFDNSTEVVVDVNPVYNQASNSYAWSFVVVDKGLFNQGGSYQNDDIKIQTAILKGVFKGLKALEENGLLKKKIYLQCNYDNILGNNMLTNEENKSRIRTIRNYINTFKLNVVLTKGNIWEE